MCDAIVKVLTGVVHVHVHDLFHVWFEYAPLSVCACSKQGGASGQKDPTLHPPSSAVSPGFPTKHSNTEASLKRTRSCMICII